MGIAVAIALVALIALAGAGVFVTMPPERLAALLRAAVPVADLSDPSWGVIDGGGYSIEINLGQGDPVAAVMLHVRGGPPAFAVVRTLVMAIGRPALDCGTGAVIDFEAPDAAAGFEAWRAYRDRVVGPDRGSR